MTSMPARPCVCDLHLSRCDASCNRAMLEKTFYMACLDLTGRPCLVVGAGPVGLEKVEGLLAAGARITVIAPEAVPEVQELAREGSIEWEQREYETSDLEGRMLVVAATSDTPLNVRVFEDAERRAMLVNVVDVPPLCNFILPAIVRTGPIAIAISTSGASPALAKRLKREIAEAFGAPHARLAEILNELRGWAKDTFPTYEERRDFFEGIVNGDPDPIALLRAGDEAAVHALIAERQRDAERSLAAPRRPPDGGAAPGREAAPQRRRSVGACHQERSDCWRRARAGAAQRYRAVGGGFLVRRRGRPSSAARNERSVLGHRERSAAGVAVSVRRGREATHNHPSAGPAGADGLRSGAPRI